MSDDDGKSKPPLLKVVSDNPDAPDKAGREIMWARERAQRTLAGLAATILRTMAGSESAPHDLKKRAFSNCRSRLMVGFECSASRGPDNGTNYLDTLISVPDTGEIFPVNFLREFSEKSLRHSGFWPGDWLQNGRNREIPC